MIEKSEFFAVLRSVFEKNGLSDGLCREKEEKFLLLTEIMLDANEKMNLTAIKDIFGIVSKHYADSLLMLDAGIPHGASVCDVGCGGGFPSFPIAIMRPDLHVTAIDSTAKKIRYINETAKKIGLSNLVAYSGRAEEISAYEIPRTVDAEVSSLKMREKFDVVTARAVASLPVLSELCLPFAKVGGAFIAMKSRSAEEELDMSVSAIKKLGGSIEKTAGRTLLLPQAEKTDGEDAERTIIVIRKTGKTPPEYPRPFAQIKKKTL